MKNKSIVLLGLIGLLPFLGIAQENINGLYETEADFKNNMVTDPAVTDEQNYIEPYRAHLSVFRKGQKERVAFGTIYGYYQEGAQYRAFRKGTFFSTNGYLKIERNSTFMIYSRKANHHRSTGYMWYYYSMGSSGTVKSLSSRNLKHDFKGQPDFLKSALKVLECSKDGWIQISGMYDSLNSKGT